MYIKSTVQGFKCHKKALWESISLLSRLMCKISSLESIYLLINKDIKKTIKYTCILACTFNPKFNSSPINETDNICTILQKTVDTFTNFACTCF